jgi:hypothetical protein
MLPVNASNIQNHISTPIQKSPSKQNDKPAKTASNVRAVNAVNYPEDVVNLSTSATAQSPASKRPSTPLSNSEKDALLNSFSGKTSFSIYS